MSMTGLHCAAQSGHIELCKYLIEKGASITVQTDAGDTPLFTAMAPYWHNASKRKVLEVRMKTKTKKKPIFEKKKKNRQLNFLFPLVQIRL
jgi:hypothetical protein